MLSILIGVFVMWLLLVVVVVSIFWIGLMVLLVVSVLIWFCIGILVIRLGGVSVFVVFVCWVSVFILMFSVVSCWCRGLSMFISGFVFSDGVVMEDGVDDIVLGVLLLVVVVSRF